MNKKIIALCKTNFCFLSAAILFLIVAIHSVSAIEVGKFAYKGALEDFSGDTINVSDTMIALSNKIFAKTDFSSSKDTVTDTPSIFFIIDNTLSMSYSNPNDQWGNRFVVSAQFIDTLAKRFPAAKVGVAVFRKRLWYKSTSNPNLATLTNYPDLGAYVPLLKLNTNYSGTSGLNLLKQFLATDTATSPTNIRYANLVYPQNDTTDVSGTCINIGFEAAKDAFSKEPATPEAKRKQYIIFLSDGEQNTSGPGGLAETYYEQGVNVPTTFTIFFTGSGNVPASINTMTTNIRRNNYSVRNDSSRFWAYNNTSANQLMTFLMTNIFGIINTSIPGNPAQLTIGSQTSTTWSVVDSAFLFPYLFPLTGIVTPFTATIRYKFSNGDTSHTFNFFVKREPSYRITPPAMYELKYWNRNLNLRNNNAAITVITETMDSLELVFDYNPGTALYNYTNVKVQVFNQLGTIRDNETFTLNKATNTFSIKFKKAVSTTPLPGNRIFEIQGVAGDSLVAIFRNSENPLLPLDTLRIAIPINISPLPTLTSAITKDRDGDGLIDQIQITFNKDVVLNSSMNASFLVKGNGYIFPVDSITKINDSTYTLNLREVSTTSPQTSWTPDLTLTFTRDIQAVVNFRTTDGCPPVVWEAKKFASGTSPANDTLKIFMSEKITAFNILTPPSEVFNTWMVEGASTFVLDNMFAGIPGFDRIDQDSILVVVMSNNKDITTNNYVNIHYENQLIKDNAGNFPNAVNQRVRVTMGGVIFSVFTGPNPARPTLAHPEPLKFAHEPKALDWVDRGQGTVIQLKNLTRPLKKEDEQKVRGVMKIIDVVGNTVTWCETKNLFEQLDNSGGTSQEMNIYWNGINQQGMMVAPGVYRVVVYINYPSGAHIPNSKVISKVGISR